MSFGFRAISSDYGELRAQYEPFVFGVSTQPGKRVCITTTSWREKKSKGAIKKTSVLPGEGRQGR